MKRHVALAVLMVLLAVSTYFATGVHSLSSRMTTVAQDNEEARRSPAIFLPSPEPLSAEDAAEIDRLVHQLSSSSFTERQAAERRLAAIGDPAVPALRAATGKGADLEVRLRAELLLSEILTKDLPQRFGESIATIEKLLPRGWTIRRTVSHSTPPDWWTEDPGAGFFVEAKNGSDVVQIWFLPLDWIGIRQTRNRAWCHGYGRGILQGNRCKLIAFVEGNELCKRLWNHYSSSTSLINGGYDNALEIFAGQLERADRIALKLVRKHCRTPERFHEAIASLQELGVPARNLFLRGARQARGDERGYYSSILDLLGGVEAIDLLCEMVTDLEISAYERKYAVLALRRHQDPRIGPALHKALKQMPDGDGLACVVKAIVHRHHKAAQADLLGLFRQLPRNAYAQDVLVQALAAFGCKEVIPEPRTMRQEFCKEPEKHKEMLASLDLALLRLTGDWGKAGNRVRWYVMAPVQPRLGEKMELTVHLENIGLESVTIEPLPEIGLFVDGKAVFKDKIRIISGMFWHLAPGEIWTFTCDLTPYVKSPGRHRAQYDRDGGCSNEAVFTVRTGKP